jgi:hypothetical protein
MLNKNINKRLPADRATKITTAVIIATIASVLAAFAINSYANTHAVWMVPAIFLCGWFLYRAGMNSNIKAHNRAGRPFDVLGNATSQNSSDLTEDPAPMVAGVFFSHAEATTARGGYDDGSSIIYGTNANGSVTPYAM